MAKICRSLPKLFLVFTQIYSYSRTGPQNHSCHVKPTSFNLWLAFQCRAGYSCLIAPLYWVGSRVWLWRSCRPIHVMRMRHFDSIEAHQATQGRRVVLGKVSKHVHLVERVKGKTGGSILLLIIEIFKRWTFLVTIGLSLPFCAFFVYFAIFVSVSFRVFAWCLSLHRIAFSRCWAFAWRRLLVVIAVVDVH